MVAHNTDMCDFTFRPPNPEILAGNAGSRIARRKGMCGIDDFRTRGYRQFLPFRELTRGPDEVNGEKWVSKRMREEGLSDKVGKIEGSEGRDGWAMEKQERQIQRVFTFPRTNKNARQGERGDVGQ